MKEVFTIQPAYNEHSGTETLALTLGNRHLGWAVTTANGQRLHQLAWYGQGELDEASLQQLFQLTPSLGKQYADTRIRFDAGYCTLVPASQYNAADATQWLDSLYGHTAYHHIEAELIPAWQLYVVYAVPRPVWNWVKQQYPKASFRHAYGLGLGLIESTSFEGSLAVDIQSHEFSVIASKGNKLLLAQTYEYETPADILYYLLKICQQFNLEQDHVRLLLTGLIDKESALYRELYQYFLEIRFREASWRTPPEEEPMPAHFFTSLNDLAQCEL